MHPSTCQSAPPGAEPLEVRQGGQHPKQRTDRRNSFPDAVALLALEAWAVKNEKSVIAVSRDADWKRYCVDSHHLYFIDDLAQALSAFQAGADDASALLSKLLTEGKVPDLDEVILEAIRSQSDKIEIDMEDSLTFWPPSALDPKERGT